MLEYVSADSSPLPIHLFVSATTGNASAVRRLIKTSTFNFIMAQVKQSSGPGNYLDLRETGLFPKFDAIYRRFSTREVLKNISGPSTRHHYQLSD